MPVSQFLQNTTLQTQLCQLCGSSISSITLDALVAVVRSYELPTEREANDLHNSRVADEKDIAAFDAAIAHAQTVLDDLRRQRCFLRQICGRKRALLAPIRRLPTEILAQIISLAVMRTFRRHRDSTVIIRHPALQVCQRWRNLATQLPELWADFVTYTHCAYGGCTNDISNCLSRSQDLPLDLELCYGHSPWHVYLPAHVKQLSSWSCDTMHNRGRIGDLVEMLLEVAPRWHSLCIMDTFMPNSFFLAKPHLPLLQTLVLNYDARRVKIADTHASIPLFSDAPNLTSVTLRVRSSFFIQVQLPWTRLTQLNLNLWGCNASQATVLGEMLDQCKALTTLHFATSNFQTNQNKRTLVVLPFLQSLGLADMGYLLLQILKAPRLQKINHLGPSERTAAYGSAEEYFKDASPLVTFAALNSAVDVPLESLSLVISFWGSGENDYKDLWIVGLRSYPGIRYLCVSDSHRFRAPEALRALLVALAHTPELLPHLERLSLPTLFVGYGQGYGDEADPDFALEELKEFIASRSAILKKVEVRAARQEDGPFECCIRHSVEFYCRDSYPFRQADADEAAVSSDEEYDVGVNLQGEWDEA